MKSTKQARRQGRRLFRLCQVNGLLDDGRARQLVRRLIEAKPRGYLAVLAQFQRLVKLEFARRAARVQSAVPLPHDLSAGVQTRLTEVYGPGLDIAFALAPALIGGMRIRVGSDVYDSSVRGRLAALEERFSNHKTYDHPARGT